MVHASLLFRLRDASTAAYSNVDMRPRAVSTIATELHVWATKFGLVANGGDLQGRLS